MRKLPKSITGFVETTSSKRRYRCRCSAADETAAVVVGAKHRHARLQTGLHAQHAAAVIAAPEATGLDRAPNLEAGAGVVAAPEATGLDRAPNLEAGAGVVAAAEAATLDCGTNLQAR